MPKSFTKTSPESPKVYLFKGTPSALSYWLRKHNIEYTVLYKPNYSTLLEIALSPTSEFYHYAVLEYSDSFELPAPPEAFLYIPTLSLVGEPLNIKPKKSVPAWLEWIEPENLKPELMNLLANFPTEIKELILQRVEHYPSLLESFQNSDPKLLPLEVEAQCFEVATLKRWLMLMLKNPIEAVYNIDPREVTIWFANYPNCIAKRATSSISSILWLYLSLFIEEGRRANAPYEFVLRQFAYWYFTVAHGSKKPVVRLKYQNGKPRLWLVPTAESLSLTFRFLENLYV